MTSVWGKKSSALVRSIWKRIPPFRGKSRLFRLFRRLTGHPRLIVTYGDRGWISINPWGEYIERLIWQYGKHEIEVWETLRSFIEQDEIIWDVGANIGAFAVHGLLNENVRAVHCFEPNPEVAELLELNLSLNIGASAVHILALGNTIAETTFHLGMESDQSSLDARNGKKITVQVTTVDEVITLGRAPAPSLMKLDVEGWEKQVLLGASNLLHSQPPKAIVFEAECDVKARVTDNELRAILEEAQYTILHIPRQSGKMHTSLIKPCFVENFVAVHFHEV